MEILGTVGFSWINALRNKEDRQNMPGNIVSSLGANAVMDTSVKPEQKTGPDPVQEFKDYMAKTPEERMQEAWLKSQGVTPEEFEAMTPAEKQAFMDKMRQELENKMRAEIADGGRKSINLLV